MIQAESTHIVVIANVLEAFYAFLRRDVNLPRQNLHVQSEQFASDRALLWTGYPKLVVTTYPVPSLDYLRNKIGYQETSQINPTYPSDCLCSDILREDILFSKLIEYAGQSRTLTLIPYCNTPQFFELVDALRNRGGVCIKLPETPRPDNYWLVHYLDTKAGFRSLISHWISELPVQIPLGFICQTPQEALQTINWFHSHNRSCLLKANTGENGYGNEVISPGQFSSQEKIIENILSNPLFGSDLMICEELVQSEHVISPSFEGFVPPFQEGDPRMTYISLQLFHEFGDFDGVLISKRHRDEEWYTNLKHAGLQIGVRLQQLGYVGYYDIDAIVDNKGTLYLLEINPRRTGGTHVDSLAKHVFGPEYYEKIVLLSNDSTDSGSATTFDQLSTILERVLFPIGNKNYGLVPTITSSLTEKKFGYILIGESEEDVYSLQREMQSRLELSLHKTEAPLEMLILNSKNNPNQPNS